MPINYKLEGYDALAKSQKQWAVRILKKPTMSGIEFNFCVNVCGLRVKELASKLNTSTEDISKYRRESPPPAFLDRIRSAFVSIFKEELKKLK